jgi:ribosome-associated heat shock protein Hsp15
VRVNREKVTSQSRLVRPGDVLTIALAGGVRVVRVKALAQRRGDASAARTLYEDETGPTPEV